VSLALVELLAVNSSPFLIKGMVPGNIPYIIQQDPSVTGAIPIERSDNKSGIEFSWSIWVNITDVGESLTKFQHIFHKGEVNFGEDGMNSPNNAPGLYVAPSTNEIVVVMNTYTTINEEVKVPNFPMNKWVNIVIRVLDNALDVYVNGSLAKRHLLQSVPKQNYGNVFVASNGGFTGNLSNLQYFTYAVQPGEIAAISNAGPDLTVNSNSTSINSNPPYLSLNWYTNS